MQVSTTNKSINFQSDRGNDAYYEREVIRIKLDAGSAPLINTQDSYLTFSLKMGRPNQTNGAYLVPDSKIGGCPFSNIQIFDGNENTLLEQMDSLGLWQAMKNYYGNNINDDQLQSVYEGRTLENNPEYIGEGSAGAERRFPTDGGTLNATKQPSLGGGFGSQYYQLDNTGGATNSARKVQILYRFPMSGLLSAMKSELLPLVVLNGLVIKITLMEGAKFLRVQKVQVKDSDGVLNQSIGYADVNEETATQAFLPQAGVNANLYLANKTVYSLHGYISAATGAVVNAGIPDNGTLGTGISGVVLKLAGDGPDGYAVPDPNNLSIKVGSYIGIGPNCFPAAGAGARAGPAGPVYKIGNRVTSVVVGAGSRIEVRFAAFAEANMTVGDGARGNLWASQNNPVICDLSDIRSDYELTDLQMVCNVVETPAEYLSAMVQQAASGQLKIQYNSYRDVRVNITTGSIANEIFIPTDLQRCYSILAVNEILRGASPLRSDFIPRNANLFNYQWIMNGANVPNIPVDLQRLANNQVSPLQIIELEKALDESSISVRNIQNPSNMAVIGRRLGAYGQSVSLLDKSIKCRINYSPSQPDSLLYNFFIYHTKAIMFEGNQRVVVE